MNLNSYKKVINNIKLEIVKDDCNFNNLILLKAQLQGVLRCMDADLNENIINLKDHTELNEIISKIMQE